MIGRPSRAVSAALAALGGAAALGCGGPRIDVPNYPHPERAPAERVGFMPPPAQIEHLDSKPPARGCVWTDGQWIWASQRWDWRPGAWVRPPAGCHYSAPMLEWAPSDTDPRGVLYYRAGRWYSVSQPKACAEAPVICPSQSPAPSALADSAEAAISS